MGKLISHIQNYPLSDGAVAYSNKLLLENSFSIRQRPLKNYFKVLLEISKDIYFFNDLGTNSNTWHDLLGKDNIFQFSRFLTISHDELHTFFTGLPQLNFFNSDNELTQDEYETLAWQRLQVIQYLFSFYKSIGETIDDDNRQLVLSILKSATVGKLFVQFQALAGETLNDLPPLIRPGNRKPSPAFNEILFPAIGKELMASLAGWFNPSNDSGKAVLTIYPTAFNKIKAANEYAYTIFRGLLQVHQTFTAWASNRLNEFVSVSNKNQPHIALLVAFSKLKSLFDARFDQLIHSNTYFVFNDILQLKKQRVLPDKALVSIELAKNVKEYFLKSGSLFKAGKNADNKDVYYRSEQDVVLNSAKIAYIKSTVRILKNGSLFTVAATDDASSTEWQVNDAWLPFNDISETYTGLGIQSKLLQSVQEKGTFIHFEFTFDKDVPDVTAMQEKFTACLVLVDGSEVPLTVTSVDSTDKIFNINTKIENELKKTLNNGINARLKLISLSKNEQSNGNVILYKFLLSEPIGKIKVYLNQQSFVPHNVYSAAGKLDGLTSFIAFGSQSLAGSSFRIEHPFLRYSKNLDITINWAEALKESFKVNVNGTNFSFNSGDESSKLSDYDNNNISKVTVKLSSDLTYTVVSTAKRGNKITTIETKVPRILQVKAIEVKAEPGEVVYERQNNQFPLFIEEILNTHQRLKSLQIPFRNRQAQIEALRLRHVNYRLRFFRRHYNNLTAHLYPLGQLNVFSDTGFTFLPDYSVNGFTDFEADLYIGLTGIIPGQSINLLFNLAEETAGQSELEAKISWYTISNNTFVPIDTTRITDSTNNFLQSGLVQLSLPETATSNNSIVYGGDTYWLVARCDKNYDVVANIRSIKTNGLPVLRVLDENNQEAKNSVGPHTIENLFPKTANVKSISQVSPSRNGREKETDLHYFWRSSQRLRHKKRAVNQWDFEQLVLENFNNVYKVKCLNHAYYNADDSSITAKANHAVISLIPHFIVDVLQPNFQPAIAMSGLLNVKNFLQKSTSPFCQLQVLNTQWDEVKIEIDVMLTSEILDLPFYRTQLEEALKGFITPWAFQAAASKLLTQKIFTSSIVDFIDELPYVHHIKSLRLFKNNVEVFDVIESSTAIHILTTAPEHQVTVFEHQL